MKKDIIKTDNYLLVVDETDIVDYDYTKFDVQDFSTCLWRLKAHLPLNNSPILEGVDLLPPLEDTEELNTTTQIVREAMRVVSKDVRSPKCVRDGLVKAKETYKYTEEDLAKCITFGWNLSHYHRFEPEEKLLKMQKDYIQSLQQPKLPIAFECNITKDCPFDFTSRCTMDRCDCNSKIKTTTNSQGQTVLVGKYIY